MCPDFFELSLRTKHIDSFCQASEN